MTFADIKALVPAVTYKSPLALRAVFSRKPSNLSVSLPLAKPNLLKVSKEVSSAKTEMLKTPVFKIIS